MTKTLQKNHYLTYGDVDAWRAKLCASPTDGHQNPEDWSGYEIFGTYVSPPSMKMTSYLRWKRLPFLWHLVMNDKMQMAFNAPWFKHIPETVVPLMVFPDGRSMNDSTFLIRAVEEQNPGRPALPSLEEDPCLRFVCQFLEDFADEWLVKLVYGMRWGNPDTLEFSGHLIAQCFINGGDFEDTFARMAIAKQTDPTGRTDVFVEGSCDAPIIAPTLHKVCAAMEEHFSRGQRAKRFMCGDAPTTIDFAFFGVFYQFILDKTPREIIPDQYPHVFSWINRMIDPSSHPVAPLRVTTLLTKLLEIASECYVPFMQANAQRFVTDENDDSMFSVSIFETDESGPIVHTQRPSDYQAKCWQWLSEDFSKAMKSPNSEGVEKLEALLRDTGCFDALSERSAV